MKITFHCTCNSYLEAAGLEEFLKREGLAYEERINDGSMVHREEQPKKKKNAARGRTRHRMDGEAFAHIRNCLMQHPNWGDSRIKKHFNLIHSSQTINRVRNGHFNQRFISTHAEITRIGKKGD